MTLVRLIANTNLPIYERLHKSLIQQTPNRSGKWDDIEFTFEETGECDYAVILTPPSSDIKVSCPPGRLWNFIQLQPNTKNRNTYRGDKNADRIYTVDETLVGDKYFLTPMILPWRLNKNFDQLKKMERPFKPHDILIIDNLPSSVVRENVLKDIRYDLKKQIPVINKLNNYREMEDQLYRHKYALILDEPTTKHYWGEHISDILLSWTIPIVIGQENIHDFFPQNQ